MCILSRTHNRLGSCPQTTGSSSARYTLRYLRSMNKPHLISAGRSRCLFSSEDRGIKLVGDGVRMGRGESRLGIGEGLTGDQIQCFCGWRRCNRSSPASNDVGLTEQDREWCTRSRSSYYSHYLVQRDVQLR